MSDFLRPDVFVSEQALGEKPILSSSTSTGAIIGVAQRGLDNTPIVITSWTEYITKFANGMPSPFLKNSYLANAVFGFFQNGGSRCYIIRVTGTGAMKATGTVATSTVVLEALDKGDWANDKLVVEITASGSNFDIEVMYNGTLVERFADVTDTVGDLYYYADVIRDGSSFIRVKTTGDLVADTVEFTLGANGTVADADYTSALNTLDVIQDVNLVAIPGKTESTVVSALLSYCDNRNDCFAIIDTPKDATVNSAVTFAEALTGTNGAVYYPWGVTSDPISTRPSNTIACPPSGHIMGVFARTDFQRGIHKVPAGSEANVRGFVGLATALANSSVDTLNSKRVNVINAKPNTGIVVWGARTLSRVENKRYISDVRYELMMRKALQEGTQWAVFEPNNEKLWSRVDSSLRSFLDSEWKKGALRGEKQEDAYYVKCDSELNSDDSISKGMLVAEVGYSKQRPAEFVVIKLIQKTQS